MSSSLNPAAMNSVLDVAPRKYNMLFDSKDVKRADDQILSSILSKGTANRLLLEDVEAERGTEG